MKNIVFAKYKNARGSVRKVRPVLRLIRGMNAVEAMQMLPLVEKRASDNILKTLQSAIANAKNNFSLNESELFVAVAEADQAMKAFRPRFTRGRVRGIERKWCHIRIGVSIYNNK
jgi:large subunit ribosomal protein L22